MASMTHDLKNPIQSLTGFSQALLQGLGGDLTEKQSRFINIINKNANSLHRMIINLTDYSKIEADKLLVSLENFNLNDSLNDIKKEIDPLLEKKDYHIEINIDSFNTENVYTDKEKFVQILYNLLYNSIKYTPEGYVRLEIKYPQRDTFNRLFKKSSNKNINSYLQVIISDSGKGLSSNDLKNLFNEYVEPDDKSSRRYGITGLNLVVSKKLVELLGGFIWVESNISEGVVTSFVIPCE
ncbi:MAG: HAMP domain-containing sensor histidine kinase [Cyanobacteriota bacterium]